MEIAVKRMRELRLGRRWSQRAIAERMDVSSQVYRNLEEGKLELGIQDIVKIAKIFDVTSDYLLGRVNNPRVYWSLKKSPP